MLAGLPWATWLLLLASFGIGLGVQLTFWLRRRRPVEPGNPASSR